MEKIILFDNLWGNFIGQAIREKTINLKAIEPESARVLKRYSSYKSKDEALILFLLHQQTIIPDDHLNFSIPELEDLGLLKTEQSPDIMTDIFSGTDWTYKREPDAFRRGLSLVIENREFVLPKFRSYKCKFVDYLAFLTKKPKIKVIDQFIDFAHSHFLHGKADRELPFCERLSDDILDTTDEWLRDGKKDPDQLSLPDTLIFGLIATAERICVAKHISKKYQSPAAGQFSMDGRYALNSKTNPRDPSTIISDYITLKQTFQDTDLNIPIPHSISDAIKIKKDPNFEAFRKQFVIFQSKFSSGKVKESQELLKELKKAQSRLKISSKITKGLKFITYSALPISILETLTIGLPIISTTTTIISTAGQATCDNFEKNNAWVLFGK